MIEKLGYFNEDANKLEEEVFRQVEWTMMDRGSLKDEEAVIAFCKRLPEHLHKGAKELTLHWWNTIELIPNMVDILRDLKNNGYKLYVLSNASHRFPQYFYKTEAFPYFEDTVYSASLGLLKPEREIYKYLLDKHSLEASECVFIDDTPSNVEGAIYTGIKGIVFKGNPKRLREELQALGVNIPL
ncbi:MAG: HAD family phosphatase [Sphaerochaetaceae bacterium]|nr:HAD family phosphatase [Sphaerochaetaceae bacterium]